MTQEDRLDALEASLAELRATVDAIVARLPRRPSLSSSTPQATPPLAPCTHKGPATRELVKCVDGCTGSKTKLVVFGCAVHGRCTIARRGEGVKGCCKDKDGKVCGDYE